MCLQTLKKDIFQGSFLMEDSAGLTSLLQLMMMQGKKKMSTDIAYQSIPYPMMVLDSKYSQNQCKMMFDRGGDHCHLFYLSNLSSRPKL